MRLKKQPERSKLEQAAQSTKDAATDHPRLLGGIGAALVALIALFALLRDRGRRRKAAGAAMEATSGVRHGDREYDDVTLAHMVESALVGPSGAPKGSISVNAQYGVVELRGQVKRPEEVKALGEAAAKIPGVKDVHNLLHTPGSPPKHSPPSTPEEVRERAEEHVRFTREAAGGSPPAEGAPGGP